MTVSILRCHPNEALEWIHIHQALIVRRDHDKSLGAHAEDGTDSSGGASS